MDMQRRHALNNIRSTVVLRPRPKYIKPNISRTSSNLRITIYPINALLQKSPQANYKCHSQHGQINRPQGSRHFLRQGQDERLRPGHYQPLVHRVRHRSPRHHGSQNCGNPSSLLQKYCHVEATGTTRQVLVERDAAEGAELSAEM